VRQIADYFQALAEPKSRLPRSLINQGNSLKNQCFSSDCFVGTAPAKQLAGAMKPFSLPDAELLKPEPGKSLFNNGARRANGPNVTGD
jgi:hypothetical protein